MEKEKKKPPKGILIVTIVTVISGVLLLVMSVYAFNLLLPRGAVFLMGPAFLMILGGTSLIAATGLYKGLKWAWSLLLVLSGFGAAGYLLNVVNGQLISLLGVAYNSIIIWYLYRPHVRKYYGKTLRRRK